MCLVGGLIPNTSLTERGLVPKGYMQFRHSFHGDINYNIIKIKTTTTHCNLLLSAGHPSNGNMILAISLCATTGSNAGKADKLYVANLAGSGSIVSAIAYYNVEEQSNIIEIRVNNLSYAGYSLMSASYPVLEITKIKDSEYSADINTNYVSGQVKNWT